MSEEIKTTANKSLPPAMLAAALGLGVIAFFVGRGSAPATAPPTVAESVEEEHGHGEEGHGDEHSEEIKFEGNTAKEAGIVVAPVSLQLQTSGIPFNGQIAANPNSLVRVSSLVPGRIASLRVSPGDKVTKGQTLAVVESRAIGEAQSGYQQAVARFDNARSNLDVVMKQARAGVFSRAPIEAARRAVVDAQAEVRAAQLAFDNANRLAKAGSYANPALEAARAQSAAAREAVNTAQSALDNAQANVAAAQRELERRKQLAASGTYVSRPVEEARRALVAARSGRASAQSELATARANLSRAKSLVSEGLVAKREVEAAQSAFDTATANLETAQSDEATAAVELERQQKLASTDVAGASQVQAAASSLSSAQADVRARQAELARAREGLRLADVAQKREQNVFDQNIANRRETGTARNTLTKAQQTLALANSAYAREQRIFKENLNNIAQVQAARAVYVQAQSDLRAACTALSLLKSSPGGGASIPITAPISGIVQERNVAPGEVLASDANIVTLVNLDSVMVEAAIYERDIARVCVGSTVKLTVDSLAGRSFNGRIETIATKLDPETRTLTARAFLPNPGGLKIGMFAKGQIVTASSGAAITVPDEALQKLEEKTVVFVAGDEPNSFVAREVETGVTQNGRTVIKNGLKGGDRVVVKGAFMVKAQAMKAELGHSH